MLEQDSISPNDAADRGGAAGTVAPREADALWLRRLFARWEAEGAEDDDVTEAQWRQWQREFDVGRGACRLLFPEAHEDSQAVEREKRRRGGGA